MAAARMRRNLERFSADVQSGCWHSWLGKLGFSRDAEQRLIGAPLVDPGRNAAARETCSSYMLIHIGNGGTTFAFDKWGILFLPEEVVGQPTRAANGLYLTHVKPVSGLDVGNTYTICETGTAVSVKADGREYAGAIVQRWNS